MERKIGEIFEYNGEWYQCVEGTNCRECDFSSNNVTCDIHGAFKCTCKGRSDETSVVFKKLEKVGELNMIGNKLIQRYKIYPTTHCINVYGWYYQNLDVKSWTIDIEIKQNKEDMEEKKLNLKPFDIQKAREGKPVCTRDGRKARIICFDRISCDDYYKIVACVTAFDGDFEEVLFYGIDGYIVDSQNPKDEDLMMLPEKKEGWVNVYRDCDASSHRGCRFIYDTKERAVKEAGSAYITTIKINWEE